MSVSGGGQPAGGGQNVVIVGVTWPKVFAVTGTFVTFAAGAIYVLVGLIYGGIQDRLGELQRQVQGIESNFNQAVASGARVQALLGKSPELEKTIADTRVQVGVNGARLKELQKSISGISEKLSTIRQTSDDTKVRVENVQFEMRQILPVLPGLRQLFVKFDIPPPKARE